MNLSLPQSSPPPALRIQLFGPMQVEVHGQPLPRVRTRSVEWLLALLTLRQGRVTERSWLAGTLWPESEEKQALANLRNDLMFLRKALGDEATRLLSPSRNTLQFDLQGVEADVAHFDALANSPEEAALRRAVALYRGPLLEGCDEVWVFPERNRREQVCLQALETLAARTEARGDYAEALTFLHRAEQMDALSDAIQRGLMRVLAASGDAPAALLRYRDYRQRLRDEMNLEPDAETTALFQQIRAESRLPTKTAPTAPPDDQAPAAETPVPEGFAASRRAPLPHALTALLGREGELQEITKLTVSSRLVTLVGGGGVGKTRLAIEAAREVHDAFTEGVAFVALASLTDPTALTAFVATELGMQEEATTAPERLLPSLTDWLAPHRLLLVLDNCEHLIEAIASLAQTLLERCPHLHLLATSRQRLGLTGEIVWRLSSLACPDPAQLSSESSDVTERVLAYPAAQLFAERAAMARPGFFVRGFDESVAVAQVCQRLDGIPLAIELAAARVGMLSVKQIASRLDDRFRLLTGGSRGALSRHQTLRALIDWSYELLPEVERVLLCRLSVFVGGWTLEAAEAVTGEEADSLEVLSALLDKSLVVAEERETGVRYRMLETVREYALERLRAQREEEAAREQHADLFLAMAEQVDATFKEHWDTTCLDPLESEHDNLRAALTFYDSQEAMLDKAARLAVAMGQLWNYHGHFYERRHWLLRLANRPTPPTLARVRLLERAGLSLVEESGDTPDLVRVKQMWMERLAIARQLGDQVEVAAGINGLSRLANLEGDPLTAYTRAEESLAIMRELGDRVGVAQALYQLGHLALEREDQEDAHVRWMECLTIDQEMGVKGGHVMRMLGELALQRGEYAEARHLLRQFVTEQCEQGAYWGMAWGLEGFGALALGEGKTERAARLLGAALAWKESIALSLPPPERTPFEKRRQMLNAMAGEAAVSAIWEAGRTLTYEEGMALALEEDVTG